MSLKHRHLPSLYKMFQDLARFLYKQKWWWECSKCNSKERNGFICINLSANTISNCGQYCLHTLYLYDNICIFEVKLPRKPLWTCPRNQTKEKMLWLNYNHIKLVPAVIINSFLLQKNKDWGMHTTVKTVQGALLPNKTMNVKYMCQICFSTLGIHEPKDEMRICIS